MLIGSIEKFAVHFEVKNSVDNWVFGDFLFYVHGVAIGNKSDDSVDLKGCLRWLRDLANSQKSRYEPELYEAPKDKVYSLLASSVLISDDAAGPIEEPYEDTFSRFHISHVGMSSFDNVTLLFLKNENGLERLIWKTGGSEINDANLSPNEIEQICKLTADALDLEIVKAESE